LKNRQEKRRVKNLLRKVKKEKQTQNQERVEDVFKDGKTGLFYKIKVK